jgi:hypothetical protein
MSFRTQLDITKSTFDINHEHKICLLGSCFSDNIGHKLINAGFDALANPLGTVFNPISISKLLRFVSGEISIEEADIHEVRGIFNHPDFHSNMAGLSVSECYDNIQIALDKTRNFLNHTDFVFITLGTSIAYWDKDSGLLVSNCHKRPSSDFAKVNIDIEQGQKSIINAIKSCDKIGSEKKYILTVSPVRHIKDGIIENSRSKARLISMVENIVSEFSEKVFYFPSYEWMVDDLRDYRFYGQDMIHPSDVAVDYIWEKFIDHYMISEGRELVKNVVSVRNALNHIPFNPKSDEFIEFKANTESKAMALKEKLPWIEW